MITATRNKCKNCQFYTLKPRFIIINGKPATFCSNGEHLDYCKEKKQKDRDLAENIGWRNVLRNWS